MVMNKEFTAFGVDLSTECPHWLRTIGSILIMLSSLNMDDTKIFLKYPKTLNFKDQNLAQGELRNFLLDREIDIEGYTLQEVTKWFLWFVQDWHEKDTKKKYAAKKNKLEQLKKEVEQLEKELSITT